MKNKKLLYTILSCVFGGVFLVAGFFLVQELLVYQKGTSTYDNIYESAVSATSASPWEREIDFAALLEQNPDTIGWVYLPNSNIDYPVVLGDDNEKYLNTLFTGESNKAGTVFMDYMNKSDLTGENTVLYGHNMRNGSMFKDLNLFKEQSFYDNNKNVYYYDLEGNIYQIQVFSAFITNAYDSYFHIGFGTQKEQSFAEFKSRSMVSTTITPTVDDHIMTLSTCTYETDDARFAVQGVISKLIFDENGQPTNLNV